jgi:PleD family two-component response regulator
LLSRYTNTRSLQSINPDLPAQVVRVCERLMQVSPSARYQTASEAVHDLRAVLGSLGEPQTTSHGNQAPLKIEIKPDFRLLVVDSQKKRCEVVREYFEKHGFQVAFMASAANALQKLKSAPPDGILFLADTMPAEVLELFPQVQAWARSQKVPCLAVFATADAEAVRKKIASTRYGATMFQPATLRDIRTHFEDIGAVTKH